MRVLIKIAFRNLKEHRTKTLIIGMLITVGIAVLVVGNSLMDTAAEGIRRTYTHSYTGDIIITGLHRSPMNLFGVQDMDGLDASLPVIPDYDDVYAFAVSHPDVVAVNPQATALAIMHADEEETVSYLFGIDPVLYQQMFPDNLEIVRGRFLQRGEEGIVLNESTAETLEKALERSLQPGDKLLLTSTSELSGIKVREVPIRGIFRFVQSDVQMEMVSLLDIGNLRALAGMKLSAISPAELTEAEAALFSDFDEDALFGGGPDSLFGFDLLEEVDPMSSPFDETALLEVLVSDDVEGLSDEVEADSKAWHFLLVQLRPGASEAAVMADFQAFFAEQELAAKAVGWLEGAGTVASLAYGVKSMFNVVILVIAIVAVIIIMNTLVISVTERTTEIGTMRALGAQKSFVRRMIAWETLMISGIFGGVGVIVGCVVLWILNVTGLEAPNEFFEVLFGGKVLHPVPSLSSIVMSVVLVAVIGIVSSLYPVAIALKTKPATAMQGQ